MQEHAEAFYKSVEPVSTKPADAVTADDFIDPPQECDIVMKGGVTSGIVYPPAILRIAQRFRFRSIGGTSAGAIAAAAAAAAEFRRATTGSGAGFMEMKRSILDWLKVDGNLRSLFVPQRATAPFFWLFMWLIGITNATQRSRTPNAIKVSTGTVIVVVLLVALVGALFPWLTWARYLQVAVTALAVIAMLALRYFSVAIPRNDHGLCSGGSWSTFRIGSLGRNPLVDWLSARIDGMAGITDPTRPLTFGDLWAGKLRAEGEEPSGERVIDLAMVTTCLTMNRPFRMPFDQNIYYYDVADFQRTFPPYVVNWMLAHERPPTNTPQGLARRANANARGLRALPLPHDLPVIVAARMSLSFPLLFSAIRLYAVDYSQLLPQNHVLEPVWFSDGGLSSNFPIELFDAPLPTRPTLGITLEAFPPGEESMPGRDVVLVSSNRDRIGNIWTRFDQAGQANPAFGFYGAIFNCMQNWHDSIQAEMPGYRDRIAHIRMRSDEGGVNLSMPASMITNIVARGESAGAQLVEHFLIPVNTAVTTNWNNHRRQRLLSLYGALDPFACDFEHAWNFAVAPTVETYTEVVAGAPYNTAAKTAAVSVTNHLLSIATDVGAPGATLTAKAPKPRSYLMNRPEL